ncbi:MAG: CapA family protein, partial [Patescibacteria group bacterium]
TRQIEFARNAIDAGADLIIGHHPHVIQKIEKYKGKYIIYSLGNFVFDQMWSQETREGLIAKIRLTGDVEEDCNGENCEMVFEAETEFFPVLIEDFSQPRILKGKEAEEILSKYVSL